MAELAAWLQQLRNENGRLTLAAIVERVRAHDPTSSLVISTVSNALNGKNMPQSQTVIAIARALGGEDAAAEAGREYAKASNRLDAEARKHRATATAAAPASAPVVAADSVSATGAAPLAAVPGEAGPSRQTAGASWWSALSRRARIAVVSVSVVALAGGGLALFNPFDRSDGGDGRADGSQSSAGGPTASQAGSGPANKAAGQSDQWSGKPPIAIQASTVAPVCGAVYFDGTPDAYLEQVKGGQATDAGVVRGTTVEITLQGRTPQKVIVTRMRLTVTKRSDPPSRGILVGYGQCGGGVDERHFDLDLSHPTTTWKARPETDDTTGEVVKDAVTFPYQVGPSDPEVFDLRVAKGCAQGQDCRYTIQLDWIADGKHGTTTLDNHTQGFPSAGTPPKIPTYRFDYGPNGPTLTK
ncbi:helix-turn-helix domain-containing protein [Streptomyces sp. NPDC001068]|uniref:helix-turn-helix domain-containing protein n=1 Tax=Streptomyces sp. NPDC001068 TaxID=3364544 RepID=UPI00367A2842